MEAKKTCSCGKSYWPNQAWMHNDCGKDVPESLSGGKSEPLSAAAQARHGAAPTSTFDRKVYQRVYMRSYRRRQTLMVQTAQALLGGVAERWPRA